MKLHWEFNWLEEEEEKEPEKTPAEDVNCMENANSLDGWISFKEAAKIVLKYRWMELDELNRKCLVLLFTSFILFRRVRIRRTFQCTAIFLKFKPSNSHHNETNRGNQTISSSKQLVGGFAASIVGPAKLIGLLDAGVLHNSVLENIVVAPRRSRPLNWFGR